ncbi:polynucleotide adenylyltransferase [Opitutaceae bacterium EW11]|nr:polynucleotide adenylyltransferase [Opitutaceae bacterium EW11]
MRLPDDLLQVLRALREIARPRLVGGCVRDWLLGGNAKDFDVEVPDVTFEQLQRALAPFGATDIVGRSFGVIKLRLGSAEYDFSLPRRESKTGAGHRGFAIQPEAGLSDAEAAARRDFTVNAMAYDPFSGAIIDPFNGRRDLHAGILRHTGPAFTEDPLRVLRGFQFAGRFDFKMAPETVELCRSIVDTYRELPVERVWGEWVKWAEKSSKPSRGLEVLEETGWLVHFPEVAALRGTVQDPEWHPEGDVFTHTAHCLDALVKLEMWKSSGPEIRRVLTLATLAHDFGKPGTTSYSEKRGRMRWVSPGHEAAGGPISDAFLQRIGAPRDVVDHVRPLVVNHLAHHQGGSSEFTDTAIRRLARRLTPASIDELCAIMRADHDGRPPIYTPESIARIEELQARAHALELQSGGPKPIVQGRHLIQLGMNPGPSFKPVLDQAFEAQLDGRFHDEAGGLEWLRNRLQGPAHEVD